MKLFGEQERCPGRSSCPGRGPCLTPPGQSCWTGCPRGSLGQCEKPQAPLPTGLYLRAGAAGLEGITRLSRGEVCPSSGARTPPPSPGWGEPTKRLCSCPGTNGLKAVGIGCQLATPETLRVRQREGGQVKGRTDRWMKPMQRSLALAGPAPVSAGGCGTGGSTGWGLGTSSHLHRASPRDVPVSPGNAHTALWLQQLVLAASPGTSSMGHLQGWCECPGTVCRDGRLAEQIPQQVSRLEEAVARCRERVLQDPGSLSSSTLVRFQLCRAASRSVPFVRSMNLGRGGRAEPAGDAQHWGTAQGLGKTQSLPWGNHLRALW